MLVRLSQVGGEVDSDLVGHFLSERQIVRQHLLGVRQLCPIRRSGQFIAGAAEHLRVRVQLAGGWLRQAAHGVLTLDRVCQIEDRLDIHRAAGH
ncbi:hypothetical protein D3C81_1706240 [compost metagenome]